MIRLVSHLAEHGGLLLWGVTLLLGAAVLIVRSTGAPARRQRLAELALLTTVCWLVLATIPLPRLQFSGLGEVTRPGPMAAEPPEVGVAERAVPAPSRPSGRLSVMEPNSGETSEDRIAPSRPWQEAPVASSPADVPWRPALAALYLIGSGVCLVWLGIGHAILIRIVRGAAEPEAWLLEIYRSLPPAADLRRARLLVSPRCRRPMVFGLWRARVVLPESLCVPENRGQLRAALLHELVATPAARSRMLRKLPALTRSYGVCVNWGA
jgi:hypothetical protein